jgi:hypothetical protein
MGQLRSLALVLPLLPTLSYGSSAGRCLRPRAVRMTSSAAAASPPVAALLRTCKDACDEITPLVTAVYTQLGKEPGAAVTKADTSFFSLADGVVQACAPPMPSVLRRTPIHARCRMI